MVTALSLGALQGVAAAAEDGRVNVSAGGGAISAHAVVLDFDRSKFSLRPLIIEGSTGVTYLTAHNDKYILAIEVVTDPAVFASTWYRFRTFSALGHDPITHVKNVIIECDNYPSTVDTPIPAFPASIAAGISRLRGPAGR